MIKKLCSIKMRVFMVCIFSMIILIGILFLNYYLVRKVRINTNSEHFSEMIAQTNASVNSNCEFLNGMLEKIAYNKMVQNYLEIEDESYRMEHREEIYNFISSFTGLKYGIKDIAVITNEGDMVNLFGSDRDIVPIAEEIPEKRLYFYTGMHEFNYPVVTNKRGYFSVGAHVYSTSNFERTEKMGTVIITVLPQYIFNFINSKEHTVVPNMMIWDRNHRLIYSSAAEETKDFQPEDFRTKSSEMEKIQVEGREFYYQYAPLEMMGGDIVFLISKEELLSGVGELQKILFIAVTAAAFLMLLLSALIVRSIIKPMNTFMTHMQEMEAGNLRVLKQPIDIKGITEMEVMADRYNHMMMEINDLTHRLLDTTSRLYESKIEKQQAELEYMYSQINPHFLFNTLESIKGCATDENADKTFRMVNALGKMFRYCVRSENMVTLKEELAVIESYMSLQKTRFNERLTFYNRIEDELINEACKCYIPKMILQPLLENAVVHGIEENGAVTVWLKGNICEGILSFTVQDDGISVTAEKREEIEKNLADNRKTAHIGMSNVHYRLKCIYGKEYGITLGVKEKGFQVIIRMPYEEEGR